MGAIERHGVYGLAAAARQSQRAQAFYGSSVQLVGVKQSTLWSTLCYRAQ